MKKKFLYAGMLIASMWLVGCNNESVVQDEEIEVHFSYDGETGPDYWGSLKEEWSTCDNGLDITKVVEGEPHQSPVDFYDAVPADPSFTLDYNKSIAFKMENNGHSVQFNVEEGSPKAYITINGKAYELKQFHFHSVSEHTELGVHAAMEGHFVNVAEDNSIAVVGVMIDNVAGEGNEALESAFGLAIPEEEEENPTLITINPLDMLPGGKVYSYSGSLTTPPCTEGVAWNIYTKHIGLNEEKVEAFHEHYDHNFRPLTGTY
ncbi:carbonic anhydrase [Sulfurovum mangrovi]|uniref:carbonic anhydrase n=1 Tax=Sulfurovum mangrovi TaxID=2893889 RepID=UPI001E553410|nr:carbonic anhydrase family protein [Sulfurovum mangrovi]UFH58256.1 carbonic anhydrase family protein [Sulfurovum mangrovi]